MGVLKLGYRPEDVIECFGSPELYEEVRAAGMLKPKIERRKLVLFNAADVHRCWERIMGGEMPPPRARKTPRKKKEVANVR
jgi:hypothetical protein